MSFGTRLMTKRKEKDLSQADLAKLLNTQAPVIGRYEREESTPSIEVALRLSKILEVSLDYLTGNVDLDLDQSLLRRIADVSRMSPEDKQFILRAFDALVRDMKTQKAYA